MIIKQFRNKLGTIALIHSFYRSVTWIFFLIVFINNKSTFVKPSKKDIMDVNAVFHIMDLSVKKKMQLY